MDIGEQIIRDMQKYTKEIQNQLETAVITRTKNMEKDVLMLAPIRQNKYTPKSGVIMKRREDGTKYKADDTEQPRAYLEGIRSGNIYKKPNYLITGVYNKHLPKLTHLLDLGHKARNKSMVKPIPHLKVSQDEAMEELDKDIKTILDE